MNRPVAAALAASLLAAAQAASLVAAAQPADDVPLDTAKQRFSYGMGLQAARDLFDRGVTRIDVDAFALAVSDALSGGDFRLSADELQAAMVAYQEELIAARREAGAAALARGEAFLAENGEREGVTVLDSGLQYVVLENGEGEVPSETDLVIVHYTGRLLDGTEFDSSYSRGEPTELEVGQVIPGWQQALQLMPVGSRWEVWVPPTLAYGENGAGNRIGPNETLHFEIDLVAIR